MKCANESLCIANVKGDVTGIIVYEYELRIGWGKSVSLPAQALPAPPPGQMAVRAKEVCHPDTMTFRSRAYSDSSRILCSICNAMIIMRFCLRILL